MLLLPVSQISTFGRVKTLKKINEQETGILLVGSKAESRKAETTVGFC